MTLSAIPTDTFNIIIRQLRSQGWKKIDEYKGVDAWIDYGMIVLRKKNMHLKFEWDNWTEGKIHGPSTVLQEITTVIDSIKGLLKSPNKQIDKSL